MKRALLAIVASCLVALGMGMVSWQVFATDTSAGPAMLTPLTRHEPTEQPTTTSSAAVRVVVLPTSLPVAVRIPDLGVSGKPVRLGRKADGAMEVPADAGTIGWYGEGPTPGSLGPAVLAAHVTYNGARGAFHDLRTLRNGQRIEVTRADGRTAVFRVTKVGQYAKDKFPTLDVYANLDHAGLRLITCAGGFDAKQRRYPDNIVVFAELDTVRPPERA